MIAMFEIFFLVLNIQTPPPFSLSFVSFGGVGRRRNRRYLFYTFGVLKSSPYPLFFLRYSLFFILYPTGIIGETMTMWAALPDLEVCTKCFFTRLLFGISFFFASFVPEPASEEPTSVHLCLLISHSGFPSTLFPPSAFFRPMSLMTCLCRPGPVPGFASCCRLSGVSRFHLHPGRVFLPPDQKTHCADVRSGLPPRRDTSCLLPTLQKSQDTLRLAVGPVAISGYVLALVILVIYVPGGPFMYMNMVGNRRSAFKKRNAGGSKKTA